MGTDEFRDRVASISQSVGENGWAMPLPEELRGDLDSKVADMANVTPHRWGGMLVAAHYLKEFVPEGVQWAHIDVAVRPTTPQGRGVTPARAAPAFPFAR